MNEEDRDYLHARMEMVDRQLRARGIVHPGVLEAFQQVPRHLFVQAGSAQETYADHPLPIGCQQTISQPLIVAITLEQLDPQPGHRVLEVGAGSGYQTALLARLVARVYAVERIGELTERAAAALAALNVSNVALRTGDGSLGWPEEAPFDRIVCGAVAPAVPKCWIDQLVDGGRIVTPVGDMNSQMLQVICKAGGKVTARDVCGVRFVPLIGQEAWP